jgi:hypothetical protein
MGAKAAKKSAKCVRFRLFSGLAKAKPNAIDQQFFATNVSSVTGRIAWGDIWSRKLRKNWRKAPVFSYFRNNLESEVRR